MTQSKNEISGVWRKDVCRLFLPIAMLFSLLHFSCEKTDESSLPLYENDKTDYSMHTGEQVFHLRADEFSVFKDELTYFMNSLTIKDGFYHVNMTHCRLQSEKHQWVPLFIDAIESVNHMISDGSLSINDLNKDKGLVLTRDSFINKSGGISDTVPGNFRYRNLGGGLHSIWISHEAYTWTLGGGAMSSGWISALGLPWVSAAVGTISGISAISYGLFGRGGGAEIYLWNFGFGPIVWINYPPPIPLEQDMEF